MQCAHHTPSTRRLCPSPSHVADPGPTSRARAYTADPTKTDATGMNAVHMATFASMPKVVEELMTEQSQVDNEVPPACVHDVQSSSARKLRGVLASRCPKEHVSRAHAQASGYLTP